MCVFLLSSIFIASHFVAISFGHSLPCEFIDSVNITDGVFQPNNSIIFNGIEFTQDQYAEINYILKDNKMHRVEPYRRGCPCKRKPCIRLCCPYGSFSVVNSEETGFKCRTDEAAKQIESEILNEINETVAIKFEQYFGFVDRYCNDLFFQAEEFQISHVSILRILYIIENV